MSDIVTVRDSEIVAAEINTIKEETRRIMIYSAIQIGGKLTEAKSMVPFGEWGKWLEEKVEYSQSTANNLMQLYREYGKDQESLFDNWTNSETFGKLSYSQHLALLALPFADRLDFAESHDAENMSARELEKAVREELEATKAKLAAAEQRAEDAEQKAEEAERLAEKRNSETAMEAQDAKRVAEAAEQAKARAEKSEQNALDLVEKYKKQLADAQAAETAARDELKKARENPDVPDAVMEQLRKEAEAEATQKAAADLQKQLDAAQKTAADAVRAREAAEKETRMAREKLAAAQKSAKLSNPDVAVFNNIYNEVQMQFNRLVGSLKKIRTADPDTGGKLQNAVVAMLDKLRQDAAQ